MMEIEIRMFHKSFKHNTNMQMKEMQVALKLLVKLLLTFYKHNTNMQILYNWYFYRHLNFRYFRATHDSAKINPSNEFLYSTKYIV